MFFAGVLSLAQAGRTCRACPVFLPLLRSKGRVNTPDTQMADDDFQSGESGASNSFPQQCSALRKNGYVLIKNRPCKIVEMTTSKTGKHGHAKVHLVGLDIFTGKKYEDICPSTHNMQVPKVTRHDYQLADMSDDGFLDLMADNGSMKNDIKVPEGDLGKEIKDRIANEDFNCVTVLTSMGSECVISIKSSNK
ncbi:hypothetical protein ScPMuIL_008330 [Solemya velum]